MLLPLMPLRNPPRTERGGRRRTRSLAAEFNATSLAPKSEPLSIIIVIVVVVVLTRERVESILTTHLLKKQPRSFVVVAAIQDLFGGGFNRAGELFAQSFGGGGAFSKNSAGATFCIHHFSVGRKAARQRDMRARTADSLGGEFGDTRAGGRQKAECHKKRRQKKKTLREEKREKREKRCPRPR